MLCLTLLDPVASKSAPVRFIVGGGPGIPKNSENICFRISLESLGTRFIPNSGGGGGGMQNPSLRSGSLVLPRLGGGGKIQV